MLESMNEAFKGKGKSIFDSLESSKKLFRGPGRLTAAGEPYADYEGLNFVASKSGQRPALFDQQLNTLAAEDGKPYSGCYANVVIDVYTMTDPKMRGVFGKLISVQFVKDGDAFGNRAPATADDFEKLEVSDDDIPF
jgi:hypothetical protein